jgi:hypothetical protein
VRGPFRRFLARSARLFGLSRRRFLRRNSVTEGPVFLTPAYDDPAWSFTRASEAAFVDPRDGWAFVATDFPVEPTSETVVSDMSERGTSITAGVADPWGGTTATTLTDDDASGFEGVNSTTLRSDITPGRRFEVRFSVKKDADETVFPELSFAIIGASFTNFQINKNTGAIAYRSGQNATESVTVTTNPDDSGWWDVVMVFTAGAGATGVLSAYIYAATSATLGGASSTALQGSVTVTPLRIYYDRAWLANDEPRVLPDGALLVEEARTNLWEYSSAFTDPPVDHLNGPTVVDGVDAPDGSLSADAVTWASGGAAGQIRDLMADGGFPNGAALSISVFARDPDEADLELLFRDKALVNDFTGGQAMPADWGRLVADVNAGTGTADPLFVLYESTDGADFDVWGGQVEAGAFPTSPIRTSGATATRAGEIPRLAAADGADDALAAVLAGGFAIDYWPEFGQGQTTTTNPTVINWGVARLRIYRSGIATNQWILQVDTATVATCIVDFDALDHLRFTVTHDLGAWTLTVENITQGLSDTDSGVRVMAVTSGFDLFIGRYSSGAFEASGVFTRPVTITTEPVPFPAYDDAAWTFTRASEAALVDPRAGWAFAGTGLESTPFETRAWSEAAAVGTDVITAGAEDEAGGTSGTILTDNNGAAYEYIPALNSTRNAQPGSALRVEYHVKQTATPPTSYPELRIDGPGDLWLRFDTQTGDHHVTFDSLADTSISVAEASPGWWRITIDFVVPTFGNYRYSVYPAITTTLTGANTVAATGSIQLGTIRAYGEAGWLPADVPRVLPDGSVLIEGERTNLLARSTDLNNPTWVKLGGTPTLVQDETAPDGSLAWSFDWSGGGADIRQSFTAGDSVDFVGSVFIRHDDASEVDWRTRDKAGALAILDVFPGSEWARYALADNAGVGGNAPIVQLVEQDTDRFAMWNAQVEEGTFPTSPIRTDGATATRAAEVLTLPAASVPRWVLAGGWEVDVWPNYASGTDGGGAVIAYVARQSNNDYLQMDNDFSAGSSRVQYRGDGGSNVSVEATWAAGDKVTIRVDRSGELLTVLVNGVSEGTAAIPVGETWTTSANDLTVGRGASAGHIDGVISPLRRIS